MNFSSFGHPLNSRKSLLLRRVHRGRHLPNQQLHTEILVNNGDNETLRSKSEHNIAIELARLDGDESRWEWLVCHLEIYLRRLDGFCNELEKSPKEFSGSSLFYNIEVVNAHIDKILKEQSRTDNAWSKFTDSLSKLPNAKSAEECIKCFELFRRIGDT